MTRLMMIFGLLITMYVIIRWVSKPESFYWYGHYRGAALAEVASLPVHFAERAACAECHTDEADQNRVSPHNHISCQSCHGPGQAHVDDPAIENIVHPIVTETCLLCHLQNNARPKAFPQIDITEHTDGMACNECHLVHNPEEFQ